MKETRCFPCTPDFEILWVSFPCNWYGANMPRQEEMARWAKTGNFVPCLSNDLEEVDIYEDICQEKGGSWDLGTFGLKGGY